MKNKLTVIIIIALVIIISVLFIISCVQVSKLTIEPVNTDRVFFPYYNSQTNNFYYLGDKGIIFYKYDPVSNQKNKITDSEILGVDNVLYSNNGNIVAIYNTYPTNNIKLFDLKNNKNYDLNSNIVNIITNQDINKIYYSYEIIPGPSAESKSIFNISSADIDGQNWKQIKDFTNSDIMSIKLFPSTDNSIFYYLAETPSDNDGATMYKYSTNTNSEEVIGIEKDIYSNIIFSKSQNQFIYLNKNNELVFFDILGDKKRNLGKYDIDINQACFSYNGEYIYIIKNLNELVKIQTKNSSTQTISLNSQNIDQTNMLDTNIKNLGESQDNLLYFFYNNYLYKINLNK